MNRSPRLSTPSMAHDAAPEPATDAEIDAVIDLAHRCGAQNVVIGHGRDDVSRANAARFAHTWETGGGAAAGLAQMTRRLAWSTSWEPRRTLAFGASAVHVTMRLAGASELEGMRGAHPNGALWRIRDGGMEPLHPAATWRSDR